MSVSLGTCLMLDGHALEAAEFYVSLLPDSRITNIMRAPVGGPIPGDAVLMVEFMLAGVPYQALNMGPPVTMDEAVSISVTTPDQAVTDRLWQALTTNGGVESQCGWCRDRFGLSWQIVPQRLLELMAGPDGAKAMGAMMEMKKIDIAALEAAITH